MKLYVISNLFKNSTLLSTFLNIIDLLLVIVWVDTNLLLAFFIILILGIFVILCNSQLFILVSKPCHNYLVEYILHLSLCLTHFFLDIPWKLYTCLFSTHTVIVLLYYVIVLQLRDCSLFIFP